jgi:perosamine synthetase
MHTFGHPVDMDGLKAVCERFLLPIIEDAAESLGSTYRGKHTGRFGLLGALSFNGNKIVTTGGGGAILTDDNELGQRAKHLTTTARIPHRWEIKHDQIGFNYRLPNLNAALGCAQLEALSNFVLRKRQLAQRYRTAFQDMTEATFVQEPQGTQSNYWLNAILLAPDVSAARDNIIEYLNNAGIMARPSWTLLHRLPMYRDCPRAPLPIAEDIDSRLINLPSSARLA